MTKNFSGMTPLLCKNLACFYTQKQLRLLTSVLGKFSKRVPLLNLSTDLISFKMWLLSLSLFPESQLY